MQVLDMVTVRWTYPSGLSGGPGYNIFYGPNLSTKLDSLRVFYESCKPYLPNGMSVQILGNGPKVQDSDGIQVGDWSVTAPAATVGTAAVAFVIPTSGWVVDWRTAGRNWRGHKIQGRSYFVPAASVAFSSNGVIQASVITAVMNAAQAWLNVGGVSAGVWSRPVYGKEDPDTGVRPVLHTGVYAQATSPNVPTKVVVLRSRRD